jgi:hypothetical protein
MSYLNLLDFNSYNYSYSVHRFTTHKPETCLLVRYHFTGNLVTELLSSNGRSLRFRYSGFQAARHNILNH